MSEIGIVSMARGNSGRNSSYTVSGTLDRNRRFLSGDPHLETVTIDGNLAGVAAGTDTVWAVTEGTGVLHRILLPSKADRPTISISNFNGIPSRTPDCLAVLSDHLYLLLDGRAELRSEEHIISEKHGNFVAQCVHPEGWVLIEHRPEAHIPAYIHRLDHKGTSIGEPIPFPKRTKHLENAMPVADNRGVYLSDDYGRPWKIDWKSGELIALGGDFSSDDPVPTSLILVKDHLYVLPVVNGEKKGTCLNLKTLDQSSVCAVHRSAYASATVDLGDLEQLWVGQRSQSSSVACIDRRQPSRRPTGIAGAGQSVYSLCTVVGPGGTAVLVGTFRDQGGDFIKAWYCEPPFTPCGQFEGTFRAEGNSPPKLLVSGSWLVAWKSGSPSTIRMYNLLSSGSGA